MLAILSFVRRALGLKPRPQLQKDTPAEKGPGPAKEAATTDADNSGLTVLQTANTGLSVAPDYIAKAQALLDEFNSMNLGGSGGSLEMEALKQSFVAVSSVVQLVAHVVLPPPGGSILAAAVAITSLVIKSAISVKACRELAIRCNRLFVGACAHREKSGEWPDSIKSTLQELLAACKAVQVFVEGVIKQNWWQKMLNYSSTAEEVQAFEEDLNSLARALNLDASLRTYSIAQEIKAQGQKVEAFIESHGGVSSITKGNDAVLEEFIGVLGCKPDAVMVQLQSRALSRLDSLAGRVKDMHVELRSALQAFAADREEGFHKMLGNAHLKVLWKQSGFATQEFVSWEDFFTVFPKNIGLPPLDIQLLEEELQGDGKERLRLACDLDEDDLVSVRELAEAFPPSVSLLDQVRRFKSSFKRKGAHYALPEVPTQLFGRDQDIETLFSTLGRQGMRLVKLVGGPGEGKLTIAASALRRLYEERCALGGVWRCNLSGVCSAQELIMRLIEGLTRKTLKASDQSGGEEATLRSRLEELRMRNTRLYLVLDHCEDVCSCSEAAPGGQRSLTGRFEELLVLMVTKVPNMRVVLALQDVFSSRALDIALPGAVTMHKLAPLDVGVGAKMVQGLCPIVEPGDAQQIAVNFSCNPLMLVIVIDALNEGRMSVQDARNAADLVNAADEDNNLKRALHNIAESVMRSLKSLLTPERTLLLKIAVLLPGTIDAELVHRLLGVQPSKAQSLLNRCSRCRLLEQTAGGAGYRVTPMLSAAARKIYKDERAAEEYGVGRAVMQPLWAKYVAYCLQLCVADFELYRTGPLVAYPRILEHRANVHQALRLVLDDPEAAEALLPQLLQLLFLLPYLVFVHDSTLVQKACDDMVALVGASAQGFSAEARATAQGQCKAVKAHFAPAKGAAEQEAVVRMVDEVHALLASSSAPYADALRSDPQTQLVLALALRRKGCMLRDLRRCQEAIEALEEAKRCAKNCARAQQLQGQPNHLAKLEHILALAELGGTLDYMTDAKDRERGMSIAEQALEKAHAYFGQLTPHPVTALCLTVFGYFLKGQGNSMDDAIATAEARAEAAARAAADAQATALPGQVVGKQAQEEERQQRAAAASASAQRRVFHEQALAKHNEALDIRVKVLGKDHLEVALSLQQVAISLVPLEQYDQAEANLKRSLEIRLRCLDANHELVARAYRQLAGLYLEWGKRDAAKLELAKLNLERLVEVGRHCYGVGNPEQLAKDEASLAKFLGGLHHLPPLTHAAGAPGQPKP